MSDFTSGTILTLHFWDWTGRHAIGATRLDVLDLATAETPCSRDPDVLMQYEARMEWGDGSVSTALFFHRDTDGILRLAQLALDALWRYRA